MENPKSSGCRYEYPRAAHRQPTWRRRPSPNGLRALCATTLPAARRFNSASVELGAGGIGTRRCMPWPASPARWCGLCRRSHSARAFVPLTAQQVRDLYPDRRMLLAFLTNLSSRYKMSSQDDSYRCGDSDEIAWYTRLHGHRFTSRRSRLGRNVNRSSRVNRSHHTSHQPRPGAANWRWPAHGWNRTAGASSCSPISAETLGCHQGNPTALQQLRLESSAPAAVAVVTWRAYGTRQLEPVNPLRIEPAPCSVLDADNPPVEIWRPVKREAPKPLPGVTQELAPMDPLLLQALTN